MSDTSELISSSKEETAIFTRIEPRNEAERRIRAFSCDRYPNLKDPLASIADHIGRRFSETRGKFIELGGTFFEYYKGVEELEWPDNREALQARFDYTDAYDDLNKFRFTAWHSGFRYRVGVDSETHSTKVVKMPMQGSMDYRTSYDV